MQRLHHSGVLHLQDTEEALCQEALLPLAAGLLPRGGHLKSEILLTCLPLRAVHCENVSRMLLSQVTSRAQIKH